MFEVDVKTLQWGEGKEEDQLGFGVLIACFQCCNLGASNRLPNVKETRAGPQIVKQLGHTYIA